MTLVGLSLTPSCSWILTEPLRPDYAPGDFTDCSTNLAPPVVDTLLATSNFASAIYVAGQNKVTNKNSAMTLGLFVAAMWASSAWYGYTKTSECEDAKQALRDNYYPTPYRPRFRPQFYSAPKAPAAPAMTPTVPTPATPAPQTGPVPEDAPTPGTSPSPPSGAVPAPALVPPAPPPTAAAPQQQDDDDPGARGPHK